MKFDMKILVNVARLEISQLFTEGARQGHLCTLDTFLVIIVYALNFVNFVNKLVLFFIALSLIFCIFFYVSDKVFAKCHP